MTKQKHLREGVLAMPHLAFNGTLQGKLKCKTTQLRELEQARVHTLTHWECWNSQNESLKIKRINTLIALLEKKIDNMLKHGMQTVGNSKI